MEDVETTRKRYRPRRIVTLFVGESAPSSGKFFYCGNTALKRYMEQALQSAGLAGDDDFLERFKAYGWYLDDLVLTPVNNLQKAERRKQCRDAQNSFAERIVNYRPQAIVPMLFSIKEIVKAAADEAGSNAPIYPVPFAGNGQQRRFFQEMARILPKLPREPG